MEDRGVESKFRKTAGSACCRLVSGMGRACFARLSPKIDILQLLFGSGTLVLFRFAPGAGFPQCSRCVQGAVLHSSRACLENVKSEFWRESGGKPSFYRRHLKVLEDACGTEALIMLWAPSSRCCFKNRRHHQDFLAKTALRKVCCAVTWLRRSA